MNPMYISNSVASPVEHEADVIARLLTLQGASVLELGCGKAEKTYLIAQKAASILALEVDETQLAIHKTSTAGKNIRFEHGGAENIPASNASFDLVLMRSESTRLNSSHRSLSRMPSSA